MGYFDENPIDEEMVEASGSDFKALNTGLYKAEIQNAYIVESGSSNAKGLYVNLKLESGRFITQAIWFGNSTDGKVTKLNDNNKTVYTFGFLVMRDLFSAVGLEVDNEMPATKGVKHFSSEIQAPVFEKMLGKRIEVGLIKKLEDNYQDSYIEDEKNEVTYWCTLEGKSGEEVRKGTEPKARKKWESRNGSDFVKDARKDSKKEKPVADADSADAVDSW